MSKLFSTYKMKDINLRNRVVMAPMCMYSADDDGKIKDWHFIHYGTRAIGGVGLIIMEATAVESRGRITDRDLGIWEDSQVEGLSKIVRECKKHGSVMGIQLGHAGRKSQVPLEDSIAPSAIAYDEKYNTPKEMSKEDIKDVIKAFGKGALRAKEAGFDIIEVHAAHGYLINEFLSPLTNNRDDEYGGSLINRSRFLKEIIKEVRKHWPMDKPLIVRISAEEYNLKGNKVKDLVEILNLVKDEGVDIVNVSSGGVVPAGINVYPGYQINFAKIIKEKTNTDVIGGGLITEANMAEEILQNDRADLVFLGRELLRNPYWCLSAANELKDIIDWPIQYERGKL